MPTYQLAWRDESFSAKPQVAVVVSYFATIHVSLVGD